MKTKKGDFNWRIALMIAAVAFLVLMLIFTSQLGDPLKEKAYELARSIGGY